MNSFSLSNQFFGGLFVLFSWIKLNLSLLQIFLKRSKRFLISLVQENPCLHIITFDIKCSCGFSFSLMSVSRNSESCERSSSYFLLILEACVLLSSHSFKYLLIQQNRQSKKKTKPQQGKCSLKLNSRQKILSQDDC